MNNNEQAMDAILNGVNYLLDNKLINAPFDRIYTGIIKGVNSDKTFLVEINNKKYNNISSIFTNINVNDTVKVVFPQNQSNQMFILGKYDMTAGGGSGDVQSVNGKTGVVILTTNDLQNDSGYITSTVLSSYYTKTQTDDLLDDKVDKVSGKGLSTNDYTNDYKNKLDGISYGAEVNVQSNWNQTDNTKDDFIKNKPTNATTTTDGFMSSGDKSKLDGIAIGAEVNVQSDWEQTDTSADDYIKNKPIVVDDPQDNQILKYNSTTHKWINTDIEDFVNLMNLKDVTITNVQDNQILKYDSTTQKWVNGNYALENLSNVNIVQHINGYVLKYDSATSKWVASPDSSLNKMDLNNPRGTGSFGMNVWWNEALSPLGDYAFMEGYHNESLGDYSHSENSENSATGENSHAEGNLTSASGSCSHVEGYCTTASSDNQHVEGKYNIEDTDNIYAHIIGNGTDVNNLSNALTVDWEGNLVVSGTITDGNGNVLSQPDWNQSDTTKTDYIKNKPTLNGVVISGDKVGNDYLILDKIQPRPMGSLIMNYNDSYPIGDGAFAEGGAPNYRQYTSYGTGVINYNSISGNIVKFSTTYNLSQVNGKSGYIGIEIDTVLNSPLKDNGGYMPIEDPEIEPMPDPEIEPIEDPETEPTTEMVYIDVLKFDNDNHLIICAKTDEISDYTTINNKNIIELYYLNNINPNVASGVSSHAEGIRTTASGMYSHAEGDTNESTGQASHSEGYYTESIATASHSEGSQTTASGQSSHSEGYFTTASGTYSHAEGSRTYATGSGSHAEGMYTTASGLYSHAEGYHTKASGRYQHIEGKYNIEDINNTYAHIIGNGEDEDNLSNAFTVDWEGNVVASGTITDGDGNILSDKQDKLPAVINDKYLHTNSINGELEWKDGGKVVHDTDLAHKSQTILQANEGELIIVQDEQGAGGGGGTSDYTDLTNKPKINNIELNGNKSLSDLGIPNRKVLTSTLNAGQTSITFTDDSITVNALVDIYVNHADAFPTDVDDSVSGSITLTFDSQIADLSVKLVIS